MHSQCATVPPSGVVESGEKHNESEKQEISHDD